jgi:acyl-CoA synthetase (AMP-forming)/AMP-acid ligase II
MRKFDARRFLEMAERERATHAMLVPVQYRRIMALPDFDAFDLSSFRLKLCTSAPFSVELKADILQRWPGGLVEFYGMTEGGGTCILEAHLHPDKLHTVGRPAEGSDIRLIDEEGREVAPGEAGEVVGHSAGMMVGYHRQPEKTREAEWFAPDGKRFIRTGDLGRFDADGFLTLFDRKKDMVISGGFNVYPSEVEAVLYQHEDVADACVFAIPDDKWGEAVAAHVVLKPGVAADSRAIDAFCATRLGGFKRPRHIEFVDALPKNANGKVARKVIQTPYWSGHERMVN